MNTRHTFLPDPAGLWGLIIFIVLTVFAGNKALKDGDTLWHIKMGQVMLERGELLTQDIFSHTAQGQPWHAHEWLSEIIMAALYGWAGLIGVTVFYFAVVGLTFTLLFKIASQLADDWSSSVAITISLPYMYIHLLARPHLFTWLGTALTLYLLERGGRWHWLLIPLTALWANLHGGVLFGLALQAIFIAGNLFDHIQEETSYRLSNWWMENKKPLALLGLCIIAACMTPFGYQIFTFPFKVASPVFTQGIGEWKSPDFQELWFAKYWVIAVLFMTIRIGKNLSWRWLLLIMFLMSQMLDHLRNLSIASLLLIPCFAILCKDLFSYKKFHRKTNSEQMNLSLSPWSGPVSIMLLCAVIIGATWADVFSIRGRMVGKFQPPENYSSVIEFLKTGYPDGNLLNDYEWGDYLLFGIDPPPEVFIDGRADMYGEKIFTDYNKIVQLEKETDELLDVYKIGWVLFPKDHLLIRYLENCKNWDNLYTDDSVTILSR